MAKKKDSGFEEEGAGLGENAPNIDPADFGSEGTSERSIVASAIDISPATATIEVVADTSTTSLASVAANAVTPEESKARYSRRDSLRGEVFDEPEPAAMLTADRLIDASAKFRAAPESGWRRLLFFISLKLINLGDSPKVKARKAMDARIGALLEGGTKYIPVPPHVASCIVLLVPEVVIGVVATSCPNELITFNVPPFLSLIHI